MELSELVLVGDNIYIAHGSITFPEPEFRWSDTVFWMKVAKSKGAREMTYKEFRESLSRRS